MLCYYWYQLCQFSLSPMTRVTKVALNGNIIINATHAKTRNGRHMKSDIIIKCCLNRTVASNINKCRLNCIVASNINKCRLN